MLHVNEIKMRTKPFATLMIVLLILNGGCLGIVQVDAADVIDSSDFREESWSRSFDIFDYVREHAEKRGKRPPPEGWSRARECSHRPFDLQRV